MKTEEEIEREIMQNKDIKRLYNKVSWAKLAVVNATARLNEMEAQLALAKAIKKDEIETENRKG